MKLALVVPRCDEEMAGGAVSHARWIGQLLGSRHDVAILTTSAGDAADAARLSVRRFEAPAALVEHLRVEAHRYDALLFFSCSAATTLHGLPVAPRKSLLVPTAEDASAVPLPQLPALLRLPAAYAFNTPEEKEVLLGWANAGDLPGDVVGRGVEDVPAVPALEIRQRLDLLGDFILYAGRSGREQGCSRLFEDFTRFVRERSPHLSLVLVGKAPSPIPVHVNITHLGLLSDVERRSAIGASRLLIEPSANCSLSLPLLEAWTMGRPVVVNGHGLAGQVTRASGGLFYSSYDEMAESLSWLLDRPREADALGRAGRTYCAAHYAPAVIREKYERLLAMTRGH
jgi:glycosyltransferase involved in cell wall biosynthesis